jgi:chaperonin GroES
MSFQSILYGKTRFEKDKPFFLPILSQLFVPNCHIRQNWLSTRLEELNGVANGKRPNWAKTGPELAGLSEFRQFFTGFAVWRGICLTVRLVLFLANMAEEFLFNSKPTRNVQGSCQSMATATKSKSKKKLGVEPIGDRILVARDSSEETTSGGIVLPDSAQDKPSQGTVLALGSGRLLADGTRCGFTVKVGDKILFTSYGPEELSFGDDEYLLMREDDVLAVFEG